ncbi:hypothetical protein ZEAMMB73_Zm00001d039073 [Zea mays]|uniref:Uncharacterized protein n=1 Tax=Zea mays TaxID=4577 RepID=A0A1D6MDF5_MAIZE|nr:hypothetical protein ZEAMMB73_Zm00001d039073 [Zea mays]
MKSKCDRKKDSVVRQDQMGHDVGRKPFTDMGAYKKKHSGWAEDILSGNIQFGLIPATSFYKLWSCEGVLDEWNLIGMQRFFE